jgi:hypothetical protein
MVVKNPLVTRSPIMFAHNLFMPAFSFSIAGTLISAQFEVDVKETKVRK